MHEKDTVRYWRSHCKDARRQLDPLRAKNKQLREFIEEWIGHESECDCLDEGSSTTACTCGYEKARDKALNPPENE